MWLVLPRSPPSWSAREEAPPSVFEAHCTSASAGRFHRSLLLLDARLPSTQAGPHGPPLPACPARPSLPAAWSLRAGLGSPLRTGSSLFCAPSLSQAGVASHGSSLLAREPRGLIKLLSSGTQKQGGQGSNVGSAIYSLQDLGQVARVLSAWFARAEGVQDYTSQACCGN